MLWWERGTVISATGRLYCGTFIDFDSRRSGVRLIPRLQQLHLTQRKNERKRKRDCSRASIPYTPSQSNTMYFIFLSLFLLHTQTRSPLHLWRSSHFTGLYQGMPLHLLLICLTGITDERGKKGGGRKEVSLNCSVTLCAIHSYLISI